MKKLSLIMACILVTGCGQNAGQQQNVAGDESAAEAALLKAQKNNSERPAPHPDQNTTSKRTREITNPDTLMMVYLYYSFAQTPPPLDQWVENDKRVYMAPGSEKAAARQQVRTEYESGLASMKDVGMVRLSINEAKLSEYDPTYGEFTVGALAPSSRISWDDPRSNIQLSFSNALTAQTWKINPQEAQQLKDKLGRYGHASIDVLVSIEGIDPGTNGGRINAKVLEYELRDSRSSALLAQVKLQ